MKKIFIPILLIITFMATMPGAGCQQGYSGAPLPLSIAPLHLTASTLIYVAEDQQFFSRNGLTVTLKEFDTGLATSDAVLKGQADLGTVGETVMVGNLLQKQSLSILGIMDKTNTIVLIGLKTQGILQTSDLAGKRIGLGLKTSSEFFLGRFLELNGMTIKDVILVNTPPGKLEESLSSDAVDAVVGWSPYTSQILERFNNETVTWQVQNDQPVFGLIVGSPDWVSQNPEVIKRFWKALVQAEDFVLKHQEESKVIVQKKLGYEKAYVDMIWPQYTFRLSLDQSLILAMEDEARWMISNNLTTEKSVPNFLDYINADGLKSVKPEAVRIIR